MNSDPTEGSGMIEAMAWLEVNKKRLAIGAVLVLVVGFGIYVFKHMDEQKESDASAALVKMRPHYVGTNETTVPSAEFLKVAQQYSGTRAAERALLLAAGALFSEGKYAEAQAQFERLTKEHTSSPWAADATYGIAASLESQGKRDEAVTAYQRVTTSYATSPVAGNARMALARNYEAKNQPQEALKQYEEVARGGPMSMAAQEATMRRDQLLKKHPELAKAPTNSMPAMAPMTLPSTTNKPGVVATTNLTPMTNRPASATNKSATAPK